MSKFSFEHAFEIDTLKRLIAKHQNHFHHHSLLDLHYRGTPVSLTAIELGKQHKCPTVLFVGGVHGVERIGAQVVLACLNNLINRLPWDTHLQQLLRHVRVAFLPIVNPVGFLKGTRGNGNNVDLMRNAPIEADNGATFMVGGQRVSAKLPWYRGTQLEAETRALIDYVQAQQQRSSSLVCLDVHSGFGMEDHIWFPYAYSKKPFEGMGYIYHLKQLFDKGYPHHGYYRFAPQNHYYQTHGDIWDYLSVNDGKQAPFIPLTLEMGSWAWVRKNPRQMFNFPGYFNPQKPHRHDRILRRHLILMQFLMESAYANVLEKISAPVLTGLNKDARRIWCK
ncbi:DUF2817 domain-containing protein [Shewanella waksmanii]|uniref:DUF2817 domain-containing protein n=1 Tax=Shewanella waksmanii TaxID=213783 RepID=UPI0037363681